MADEPEKQPDKPDDGPRKPPGRMPPLVGAIIRDKFGRRGAVGPPPSG